MAKERPTSGYRRGVRAAGGGGRAWARVAALAGIAGGAWSWGGMAWAQPGQDPEDGGIEQPAVLQPIPVGPPGPGVAGDPGANGPPVLPAVAGVDADGLPSDLVTLSAFSEPVRLTTLVELVATTLNINVAIKGDLQGSVVFNAPVPIKKSELLSFLDALLEQQNSTITLDRFGFYSVHPLSEVPVRVGGERATTRVFATPNLRPSSLRAAIESQLGGLVVGGGVGGGGVGRGIAYVDELGVIIATDTPRRLEVLGELIGLLQAEFERADFLRIELRFIAAPVARERALQLVGQARGVGMGGAEAFQQQQAVATPGRALGALDNLGDRLTVDPQGNALIFTGVKPEIDRVRRILAIVDVPTTLVPRQYFVGAAARTLADLAKQRGLGEVTTIGLDVTDPAFQLQFQQQVQQAQAGQARFSGGPVMVVDDARGTIVYYGTPEQQEQLAQLIREIDPQSEQVVIEVYRLRNSSAEDVADVLNGLITGSQPLGRGELLPEAGGARGDRQAPRRTRQQGARTRTAQAGAGGFGQAASEDGLSLDGNAFVIADTANNQLLVKAPKGLQRDFARLIERLDLRRPQVYIEAKIVAVTWSDDMRLRFETQLINANGRGGLLETNFGLATTAPGQAITAPKVPTPGLSGLTAALIRSDYVPLIINALQTESDARILSTPQLLVDDNEEAEIVSLDQQPTLTTNRGVTGQPDLVGFGGFEEAGTKLRVTPQIAEGGYLRLNYEAELSSFVGQATANLPPPRQLNTIRADSVTVPADSTVVIGGLTFDSRRRTVARVPLLGDIPIVGLLFQDRNTGDRQTTLYIFLTPRILREPTFADLRLLTRGPLRQAGLEDDVPELRPSVVDILLPATMGGGTGEGVGGAPADGGGR